MITKTFTVARFNQVDSQGDILMPGCVVPSPKMPLLTHGFDPKNIVGEISEVSLTDEEIKVTANYSDKSIEDLTPAIGFQILEAKENEHGGKDITKMKLHYIGLSDKPNIDEGIRPINQQ